MKSFRPKGVCSREIQYSVVDGKVEDIRIIGGCDGNLQGICNLLKGMPVQDVIEKLKGIDCDGRGTSCPDQIAKAFEQEI